MLLPLVGAYHRPPAQQILESLPAHCALQLVRQPDNPYDEHAVQVFVDLQLIPESQRHALSEAIAPYGGDLEEMLSSGEPFQLGYIAASGGKPLLKAQDENPRLQGNKELAEAFLDLPLPEGQLMFSGKGAPWVSVEEPSRGSAGLPDDSAEFNTQN